MDKVQQIVLNNKELFAPLLHSTAISREKLSSVVRDAALNYAREAL